jgi:beta-phosphoglucomutase
MKPKFGVLWDLDGVIVDTRELHFATWAEALEEHQIPFSRDIFDSIFGMNNSDSLSMIFGYPATEKIIETIAGRKEALFRDRMKGQFEPMSGVMMWLNRFQTWGWPQAVASSAPMANIEGIIDDIQIRDYFAALVSGLNIPGKPAPDVFLEAARRIKISPENCIVIEDAVHGVRAAKAAGMYCVAVTTTTSREKLHQADRVVDSLNLLPDDFYRLSAS